MKRRLADEPLMQSSSWLRPLLEQRLAIAGLERSRTSEVPAEVLEAFRRDYPDSEFAEADDGHLPTLADPSP